MVCFKNADKVIVIVGFALSICDVITDSLALASYWKTKSRTIAILASVSFGTGSFLELALIPMTCKLMIDRMFRKIPLKECRNLRKKMGYLKCANTMVESIPQLAISLYLLSVCEDAPLLQYITAIVSYLSATHGVTEMDSLLVNSKWCNSSYSDPEDYKELTLPDKVFIFIIKGVALAARMLLIIYGAYLVGWETLVLPLLPFILAFALCICDIAGKCNNDRDNDDDYSSVHLCMWSIPISILGLVFGFIWMSDSRARTLIFAVFYGVENWIFMWYMNGRVSDQEYCFHYNVYLTQHVLNGCTIGLSLIYFIAGKCVKKSNENDQPSNWNQEEGGNSSNRQHEIPM